MNTYEEKGNKELRGDCKKCFGLCCIALYFSASEGFPTNKEAGKPCINLQSDFNCSVHKNLRNKGLKGCTAYDCFGAGQKIAQVTFAERDWQQHPKSANEMFQAFLIMRQLHEMLWYLTQAFVLQTDQGIQEEINSLMEDTEQLTIVDVDSLLALDVEKHRIRVNMILKNTSELVRSKSRSYKNTSSKKGKIQYGKLDYFGKDLRKTNLIGADLRGAYLIAANLRGVDLSDADLIGADLRDADICGANLTNSIFVTQAQINTAKGDSYTKIPNMLIRPAYWER